MAQPSSFPNIDHQDDAYTLAQDAYGALRAARAILRTLHGHDDLQRDTLAAALAGLDDAMTEVRAFGRQRRDMHY